MNREVVLKYLNNTLQPDGTVRMDAEKAIKSLIQKKYHESLLLFLQIIFDSMVPLPSRQMSSIILKNCLHSKNPRIQKVHEQNWLSGTRDYRLNFISILNNNLNYKVPNILSNITKIYGSIIRIETENNTGLYLFEKLQECISNREIAAAVLDSVGNACDQLYEETMYEFKDEKSIIFNISTFYLNKETNPTDEIAISTLNCLISSMEILDEALSTENGRNQFICKIIDYTKINQKILELSLDVINRFVDVYNSIPDNELEWICGFYLGIFSDNTSDLPGELFDFWSLLLDLEKYNVLKNILNTLVPNLLLCITKEDPNDNYPSPHKSSCTFLMDLVSKMKILLLSEQMYQNFILNNFNSDDLNKHAIAATAVGCLCSCGSDDFLYQIIPILIGELENEVCANESLFALSKIIDKEISLAVNFLPTIIQKLSILIESKTKIAVNTVLVYHSILLAMKTNLVQEVENVVVFHYSDILSALIYRLDKSTPDEYELRNVLNSTLIELIQLCPDGHRVLLDQLQEYLITKIKSTLDFLKNSGDNQQFLIFDDVLCSYIILLESCLSMKKIFDIDEIVVIFLECLNLPRMLVHGEIYIVLSKLLSHFSVHLKKFIPFILRDVLSVEPFIVKSALNILSDCATLLESNFIEFTDTVVPALTNAITSTEIPLEIKPDILITIGDVALAVGRRFEDYTLMCFHLFVQINTLDRVGDEEYVDGLRKAVLQMFSCLFLSVGTSERMEAIFPSVLDNIKIAIHNDKDNVYLKESIDIIYDIQTTLGADKINKDWIINFLHHAIRSTSGKLNERAKELLGMAY